MSTSLITHAGYPSPSESKSLRSLPTWDNAETKMLLGRCWYSLQTTVLEQKWRKRKRVKRNGKWEIANTTSRSSSDHSLNTSKSFHDISSSPLSYPDPSLPSAVEIGLPTPTFSVLKFPSSLAIVPATVFAFTM